MRLSFIFGFLLITITSFSQNDNLLTINDEVINVDEFKRVYEKNLSLVKDQNDNSPEDYLQLFIDYKLKVQEAYKLDLDKKSTYIKELASYRSQLAKNYINDVEVTDELVAEAYDRTLNELRARHMLIRVPPDAPPSDTLSAYNKLLNARSRVLAGENFDIVAKEVSEDPSVKKNGGDLGWFKAFKMVYPFEGAAYATKVNEVSLPFRTGFGYHIVQPTDARVSKGSIKVAHIMVSLQQQDSTVIPENRIREVEELLKSGASFETLALNYSDDGNSSKKGGVLNEFQQGQLSSELFEMKAFEMEEIGEMTKPFKTKFGWHIIKLLEKNPIKPFDEIRAALTQKVTKDARARVISNKLIQNLRSRYGIVEDTSILSYFKVIFPESYAKGSVVLNDTDPVLSKTAFTIVDSVYTYRAIGKYLINRYDRKKRESKDYFVEKETESFIDNELKKYHIEHLEELEPAFNDILREYKEGLLLFDLLESTIWKKAQNDSVGLKKFYSTHKERYQLPKTFEAAVLTTENVAVATVYKAQLLQGLTPEDAVASLKVTYNDPIILSSRSIPENELPAGRSLSLGVSKRFKDDNSYVVYVVNEIKEPRIQSLSEARGLVMSDFQKQLEIDFVEDLRKKSTITINKEVLARLVKTYND